MPDQSAQLLAFLSHPRYNVNTYEKSLRCTQSLGRKKAGAKDVVEGRLDQFLSRNTTTKSNLSASKTGVRSVEGCGVASANLRK